MTTLVDIQARIADLTKQAEQLRSKTFDATVAEIQEKMAAYGITVKDLAAAKSKKRKVANKTTPRKSSSTKKKVGVAVSPKYRGPNGEVWSGRGLTPRWLKLLIDQGQSKESFAIPPSASDAAA